MHPLVAPRRPDNSQPPIGAEIIDVADVRAIFAIHHGLAYRKLGHLLSLRGLSVKASMGVRLIHEGMHPS